MKSHLLVLKENHYKRSLNYTYVLIFTIVSSILNITNNRLSELSDVIKIACGGILLCCCLFFAIYRKRKLTKIALYYYVFTIGFSGVVVCLATSESCQVDLSSNIICLGSVLILSYLIVLDRYHLIRVAEENLNLLIDKTKKLEALNCKNNQVVNELVTMDRVADILVETLEIRHFHSAGHSKRVRNISIAIGKQLGLDRRSLENLSVIAVLHDVGKVGISDITLNKKDKLSEIEWAEIKKHPVWGYDLLKRSNLKYENLMAVRHHHERFDGTGYPDALVGDEIPLFSRIIAIADSYDAITSCRVYSKASSHEEALNEIIRNKNSQFDPRLVEVFLLSV